VNVARKFNKLIRSPGLFFRDASRNRQILAPPAPPVSTTLASQSGADPGPKTPTRASKPPPAKNSAIAPNPPVKKPVGPEINFPKSELNTIRVLIHAGDGINSEYQFINWLQEVQFSYQRFAVLVRSWDVYAAVKDQLINCNLIFTSSANGVEQMIARMKGLRLVLYVSNTGNNLHVLRYNHLTHAFIGHGDSEKSASCHKFFRVYDEIWVSGQAHIDRFSNASFETRHLNFVRVGRGNLRAQLASANSRADALISGAPANSDAGEARNIESGWNYLYLPTWEGAFEDSSYSSLAHTVRILTQLSEDGSYKGAIKLHPMTGQRVPAYMDLERKLHTRFDQSAMQVIPRSASHVDAYAHVDFLVADISSVITDFLITLKPIFVYWPGFKDLTMSESSISIREYCYLFSTIEELQRSVHRVISEGADDLRSARRAALAYYVDLPATQQGAFQRQIRQACQRASELPALPVSTIEGAI